MNATTIEQLAVATVAGSLPFPEIVGRLMEQGVEYYVVDYRTLQFRFYGAQGGVVEAPLAIEGLPSVQETFDLAGLRAAILDSQAKGQMNEASLAVQTSRGLAVIVGCSHPGVEKIVEDAAKIDPRIYTVAGGFHLVLTPREEIQRTADALYSDLKVERVAPGHCTSEKGFAVFLDRFKERFDRAGLGAVVALP